MVKVHGFQIQGDSIESWMQPLHQDKKIIEEKIKWGIPSHAPSKEPILEGPR